MRYSASNQPGADSAQGANQHVGHAGTSRVCRIRDDYEVQRRALQGSKGPGKWCLGTCGRPGDVRRVENLGGSCSTQTWEPWTRGTCVSRSLRLRKSNETLIIGSNGGRFLAFENELSNDDYNRIFELRYESNDDCRGRIPIVAKISTATRKTDTFGICEAARSPATCAEKAVQIDLVEYKIIICDPPKDDQPDNSNLEKNPTEIVPESRLSPGPSTISATSKRKLKKTDSSVKKQTSVSLRVKKKPTVNKRSILAASKKKVEKKKVEKKITASSTFSKPATKVPTIAKKSPTTARKKSRAVKTNEKKVGSNHVVAAAAEIAEEILVEKELEARADVVEESEHEESKEINEPSVNEFELNNELSNNQLNDEGVEVVEKIGQLASASGFQERRISLPDEVFEMEKGGKDEANPEAIAESLSRCSSKCQGVPLPQYDYANRPTSSSSSSKKQLENGSTVSDKADQVRQKSYRVKRQSTFKNPRANSSTSNSTECEDLYSSSIPKQSRPPKSSLPKEKSKSIINPKPEKPIVAKNQEDKSEIVSSDESGGKSTSTVPVNEDTLQSRSFNSGKVIRKKSTPRRRGCSQSSVMMIWQWLRERYRDVSAKEFPSLIGSNDRIKDPFLSLIFPVMQQTKTNCSNFQS